MIGESFINLLLYASINLRLINLEKSKSLYLDPSNLPNLALSTLVFTKIIFRRLLEGILHHEILTYLHGDNILCYLRSQGRECVVLPAGLGIGASLEISQVRRTSISESPTRAGRDLSRRR